MSILRRIGQVFKFSKRMDEPQGDPRLLRALDATHMAEAHLRNSYPDGEMPPEAQEKLEKILEMRALTEKALAADREGDLDTLLTAADTVNAMRRNPLTEGMTADDIALFDVIDSGDAAQVATVWTAARINTAFGPEDLTALAYALARPKVELAVILALLDAGADAAAPVWMGGRALSALACGRLDDSSSQEAYELVRALAALGGGLDDRDTAGLTPLQRAILQQNIPLTEALLRAGADANATFPDDVTPDFLSGMTLLHSAVMDPDLLGLLLHYGADSAALSDQDETALEYARAMLRDKPDPEEAAWLAESCELLSMAQAA